jgi:hypothetical protein
VTDQIDYLATLRGRIGHAFDSCCRLCKSAQIWLRNCGNRCQPSTSTGEYGVATSPVKAGLRPPLTRLTALTGLVATPAIAAKRSTVRDG